MASVINSRNRRKPDRYGDAAPNLTAHSVESEPFGYDSFGDKTYTPDSDKNTTFHKDTTASDTDSGMNFEKQFEKID